MSQKLPYFSVVTDPKGYVSKPWLKYLLGIQDGQTGVSVTGMQGPPGSTGLQGMTGLVGDPGNTGATGIQGVTGLGDFSLDIHVNHDQDAPQLDADYNIDGFGMGAIFAQKKLQTKSVTVEEGYEVIRHTLIIDTGVDVTLETNADLVLTGVPSVAPIIIFE